MNLRRRLRDLVRRGGAQPNVPADMQALLAGYQGPEPERVRRAIVSLSGRDRHLVRQWLDVARLDYRDVLLAEEQVRGGHPAATVNVERLTAWLAPDAGALGARSPGWSSVVLVDAGAAGPEVLKAIRAASGLGLAEVAALVERVPVVILSGVAREEAAQVATRLRVWGATVEVK